MMRATRDAEVGTRAPQLMPRPVSFGRERVPGPTRRFDRRHFARLEGGGAMVLAIVVLVAGWFVGVDIGLLPDWLGWKR